MRRYVRCLLIALLAGSVLLMGNWIVPGAPMPVARAHAFVIGSDPVDGSLVSGPPRVVRIFFDAPISAASVAHVFAPAPQGQLQLVDAPLVSRVAATNLDSLRPRVSSNSSMPHRATFLRPIHANWTRRSADPTACRRAAI